MTDRELLEQAAKAAGIDCVWNGDIFEYKPRFEIDWVVWNPLTDDGDALRLAAILGIDLVFNKNCVDAFIDTQISWVRVDVDNDYYEATRKSIVLAAAEIEKTK